MRLLRKSMSSWRGIPRIQILKHVNQAFSLQWHKDAQLIGGGENVCKNEAICGSSIISNGGRKRCVFAQWYFRIHNQCAADYPIHLKFPHDFISNLNLFKNRPYRIHWHKDYLSITNHCKFASKTHHKWKVATETKKNTTKFQNGNQSRTKT